MTLFTKHLNPLCPLLCVSEDGNSIVEEIKRTAAETHTSIVDEWLVNANEDRLLQLMKDPKWLILYSNGGKNSLDQFDSFIDNCRKNGVKLYSA